MKQTRRVVIGKGLCTPDGQVEPHRLLQLPCPSTGQPQAYVLTADALLELNVYKHRCSSWFVGQEVVSDGALHLATPVDVLLVLLPLLGPAAGEGAAGEAAAGEGEGAGAGGAGAGGAGMFVDLDTLLHSEAHPALALLAPLARPALASVCDVRDAGGGELFYRLSRERALAWLRVKARQAAEGLREAAPASVAGMDGDARLAYALGLLGEYLPRGWARLLAASLGVEPAGLAGATGPGGAHATTALRPSTRGELPADGGESAEKKARVVDPREAARRKAEASRAQTAAAKFAKAGEGTKKLSAFFAPRPKKGEAA